MIALSTLAGTAGCAALEPGPAAEHHVRWEPRSKADTQPWNSVEEAETVAYDFRLRR
jgi:hypothetical protein